MLPVYMTTVYKSTSPLTLSLQSDRKTLVYIYIYIQSHELASKLYANALAEGSYLSKTSTSEYRGSRSERF